MFRTLSSLAPLALLVLPTAARATPFVLDVQLEGPPEHRWSDIGIVDFSEASESWDVDVARPPAGTSSMDVQISLPAVYQTPEGLSDVSFSVRCEWGTRTISAGSQMVDLLTTPGAGVEAAGLPGLEGGTLRVTGPDTGFGPDTVSIRASGTMDAGDRVRTVRMFADATAMSPTPVQAGPGSCEVTMNVFGASGEVEDRLLLERAPVPLDEAAEALSTDAQTAYDALFASRPTPDPATVALRLSDVRDALIAGGCLLDDSVQGIAGAYGPDGVTGLDGNGPITDPVLMRGTRTFGGTLSNGVTVGGVDFSQFNNQFQLYAERSDGGFVVGRFLRVRGTRGVWHALTGTCDGPVSSAEAIQPWFRGSITP